MEGNKGKVVQPGELLHFTRKRTGRTCNPTWSDLVLFAQNPTRPDLCCHQHLQNPTCRSKMRGKTRTRPVHLFKALIAIAFTSSSHLHRRSSLPHRHRIPAFTSSHSSHSRHCICHHVHIVMAFTPSSHSHRHRIHVGVVVALMDTVGLVEHRILVAVELRLVPVLIVIFERIVVVRQ